MFIIDEYNEKTREWKSTMMDAVMYAEGENLPVVR
jgi:hypothetical protein